VPTTDPSQPRAGSAQRKATILRCVTRARTKYGIMAFAPSSSGYLETWNMEMLARGTNSGLAVRLPYSNFKCLRTAGNCRLVHAVPPDYSREIWKDLAEPRVELILILFYRYSFSTSHIAGFLPSFPAQKFACSLQALTPECDPPRGRGLCATSCSVPLFPHS
jgi:hypothetical protein